MAQVQGLRIFVSSKHLPSTGHVSSFAAPDTDHQHKFSLTHFIHFSYLSDGLTLADRPCDSRPLYTLRCSTAEWRINRNPVSHKSSVRMGQTRQWGDDSGSGQIDNRPKQSSRHRYKSCAAESSKAIEVLRCRLYGRATGSQSWLGEFAQSIKLDYSRQEVKLSESVTREQLELALPPVLSPARVGSADVVQRILKEFLFDPRRCLLEECHQKVPQANACVGNDDQWHKVCRGAAQRGMFSFIAEKHVFHVLGTPVLHGLFGVSKAQQVPGGEKSVLRLILNAIPTNSHQAVLEGDILSLSSLSCN